MSWNSDDVVPLENERGRNPAAQEAYLTRGSPLLPNFPKEILIDWFQEQPFAAQKWAFLDVTKLEWSRESLTLPGAEIFWGGKSQLNRLVKDITWERPWVYKHVQENGTWTAPPIILKASGLVYLQNPPQPLNAPLHLAEGFHRVAAAHALSATVNLRPLHEFWVGSV